MIRSFSLALSLPLALTACGGGAASLGLGDDAAARSASAAPTASTTVATSAARPYTCPLAMTSSGMLDCTKLPLGDGKYSTSGAAVGSVYVCSAPNGMPGTGTVSPWLDLTNGRWDVTAKVAVSGAVPWSGTFSATLATNGTTRTLSGNGLPVTPYTTGVFPIAASDPAYAYDHNPNHIAAQTIAFTVPANPVAGATPHCMPPGGPIGVTLTGVTIYNGFDAGGDDAVAHEEQDACHGHPDPSSTYHYHGYIQACSGDTGSVSQNSALLGYARDGFGIYGPWYNGKVLTSADLDVCHGTTSAVVWDGKLVTMYHYVSTYDFPYTVGCYRGTPV